MQLFAQQYESLKILFLFTMIIVHFVLATGVARDVGHLIRQGKSTWLVSGLWWVFSTLLTGVVTVLAYWVIHHSNLAKQDKLSGK